LGELVQNDEIFVFARKIVIGLDVILEARETAE
jgi:hypothetical protein